MQEARADYSQPPDSGHHVPSGIRPPYANDILRTESPGFHRNRKVVSCKKLNEMDIISGLEIKGFLFIKKDPR